MSCYILRSCQKYSLKIFPRKVTFLEQNLRVKFGINQLGLLNVKIIEPFNRSIQYLNQLFERPDLSKKKMVSCFITVLGSSYHIYSFVWLNDKYTLQQI